MPRCLLDCRDTWYADQARGVLWAKAHGSFLFFFTDSLDAAKASKLVSAEPVTLQAAETNSLCSIRLVEEADLPMPLLLTFH